MSTQNKLYYYHADLIRALAILGVVFIHVTYQFVTGMPDPYSLTWWLFNLVQSASRVAVPLFVMLSGYLLLNRPEPYPAQILIKKTINRLLIPLLFWFAVTINRQLIWWHLPQNFGDIVNLFLTSDIYHLYYLQVGIGLYLFSPVLNLINQSASHSFKQYFFWALLIFGVSVNAVNALADPPAHINMFNIFTLYLGYFYFGYLVKDIKLDYKNTWYALSAFFLLTVITAVGYQQHWFSDLEFIWTYISPNVAVMSMLLFMILVNADKLFIWLKNKLIVFIVNQLSSASYGIYLIHLFIMGILGNIPIVNTLLRQFSRPVYMIPYTLVILFLCLLITKAAVKLPLIKRVFGES